MLKKAILITAGNLLIIIIQMQCFIDGGKPEYNHIPGYFVADSIEHIYSWDSTYVRSVSVYGDFHPDDENVIYSYPCPDTGLVMSLFYSTPGNDVRICLDELGLEQGDTLDVYRMEIIKGSADPVVFHLQDRDATSCADMFSYVQ